MSDQNNNPEKPTRDNNTEHAADAAKTSGSSPPAARSENELLRDVLKAFPRWMYEQVERSRSEQEHAFFVHRFGARIGAVQRALAIADMGYETKSLSDETRSRLIELAAKAVLEDGFDANFPDGKISPSTITDVLDAEEEE